MTDPENIEVVDAEPVIGEIVAVPWTGEALALTQLTDRQLAEVLDEVREFEAARLRTFKRQVQDEALWRMDAAASWTIHTEGGFKLTGDSPARTDIDVDELRAALEDIDVPSSLIEKAIKPKPIEYVVSRAGLNALRKLGGEVATAIAECERPSTKPRSVRVSRELS